MIPGETDKRTRILLAAVNVFSRRGYHCAKIEDIAQIADVGKGTVYEYFDSKQQLFGEMFKYGYEQYWNHVTEAVLSETSFEGKLRTLMQSHLDFLNKSAPVARIIVQEYTNIDRGVYEWIVAERQRQFLWVKSLVEAAVQSGEVKTPSAEVTTMVIQGAISAVGHSAVQRDERIDAEKTTDILANTLLHGISAKG
ncbi:TetR family transcriptional regulator [Heliobacterium undosum]|uniref:TetR family transcriptional regulator n=1 Tax=Heliomicrobium undosum TaxID=121734 RepID=A0A845L348_9FIRM|nr:TetR/AcrR family transcriptional regulator [Heliomicrobium undosum]MZP29539.1 TetR family transcriptional regulator [Heliomicrobium undosum]